MTPTLPQDARSLDALRRRFSWTIPEKFNIAAACCDAWAATEPEREALIERGADGARRVWRYGALKTASDGLAARLRDLGVRRGDRVAILAAQRAETLLAHLATYKLGAVAVPLFTLFGEDALAYRLADSGATLCLADALGYQKLVKIPREKTALKTVIALDGCDGVAFSGYLTPPSAPFVAEDTLAEDPALIIYTSGTTGPPKGALHAHRVLIGHLPGVEMSHDFLGQPGDKIWTPADWAWIGGLLDVALPALALGAPLVARRFEKFDAGAAFDLIADEGVQNLFLPPTALKMMRRADTTPALKLRSVASGGEALGPELLAWGREVFGVEINEFYGQTECNMVLSQCGGLEPVRAGVAGFAVPGHHVAVIGANGAEAPEGVEGEIAVRLPDPVSFLGYWNRPEATAAKTAGGWLRTGDRGVMVDAAARAFRFVGRDDDVIASAGYRIGPNEIEDALLSHPSVALAAAVGAPDALRGEVVVAFVTLDDPAAAGDALAAALQAHVKARAAAHAYPRKIYFVDALPMTATGKIQRGELRRRLAEAREKP